MSWWTLLGGAIGLALGGPLGALLGAALGNAVGAGASSFTDAPGLAAGDTERVQTAFFTAAFAIMGHVAKSDGRVTRDEIAMAERVMAGMRLDAEQRRLAMSLFNEGKQDGFPAHEVLEQFRRECHRRRHLIQMFMEIIVGTALADARYDPRERSALEGIAAALGYTPDAFAELMGRMTGQAHFDEGGSARDRLDAAHELLGVEAGVGDAELKKAYRRQMSQHHPDKLVAKGLPEEMMEIATRKTQDIKAAYELIRERRRSG